MKKVFYTLFTLFVCHIISAQQLTTDESVPLEQLVAQLVQGCVEISNVTSSINGSANNFQSYAYFDQAGSNFPFANGLVLTSGRASDVGSPLNTDPLNSGTTAWGTDPDIATALGINNTVNATSIEFDFIAVTNQISFNYLLASEEYAEDFPCRYSDTFAFLIRPTGSTVPYTNIAVIPGTNIPVSTSVIHDEIVGFCPADNPEYFEGYNVGDTNYNGRTKVLTATADLVPNQQYHIKLIIADGTDQNADSAIFVQGNSFNATVDLGPDITTCANSYNLTADIGNPLATYQWFRDNAALPNSNTTMLTANVSGTYRVEITIPIGTGTCVIEDSVVIQLNEAQTAGPIADYELCDDLQDGVENFTLTTKDSEILATVPLANYQISYHATQSDAENDINPYPNTIPNTTNPQEIFVRVRDIDNGCLAYTSFNLIVNPLPNITNPTPIDICDVDADGIVATDLTVRNDEITGMNMAYGVTYHFSQSDADNNLNPIIGNYTNTSQNDTVFVRVVNTETGCYITTTLIVNVSVAPDINDGDRNIVDACDTDHDGFATFDLTDIINEITMGLTGVNISVHTSNSDAQDGINPIADSTSFDNTEMDFQSLYVRVENTTTGCFSIATVEVHTNALLTATNISNVNRCDDDSNDGVFNFDLLGIASDIQNNLEGITIDFYLAQDDRDNGVNAIDTSVLFTNTTNPQEIFITLTDDEGCVEASSFDLIVDPAIILGTIGTLTYCDTDDDGFTQVNLEEFNPTIQGANTTYEVTYFETLTDANTLNNAIASPYTNQTNPQEIFVRITNPDTGCSDVSSFMLEVLPAPTVTQPSTILICDDDTDGIASVNITASISEIIADTTNIDINFFQTMAGAQDGTIDLVPTPSEFVTSSTNVFIRLENETTGCFAIVTLPIIINTVPDVVSTDIYQLCETDNDQTENFIMETKDDEILNGQTNMSVLYYPTAQDALDKTNEIDKTAPYPNQANPQTIHVRIENDTDPDCFATSSFVIQVRPAPIFNQPIDIFVCDDSSNDGVDTFNFNTTAQEITQGISQNLNVAFFLTENDANMNVNAISNTFTNTTNPQAIFARITNDSDCHTVVTFEVNVIQVPETNSASDITVCDEDYDGQVLFNLTVAEIDILNIRQDNILISYHELETDAETGANAIPDPTNYTNSINPQPIFVRLINTISQCYVIVPFTLNINLPPSLNNITEATFCEAELPGTVNLRLIDEVIIDDPTGVNLSYYNSAADAEAETNPLPDIYTHTSNPETIFIRAENETTGCYFVTSIQITINPNPMVNPVSNLEACIAANGNFTQVFNLSQQTGTVLGSQSSGPFDVSYHVSIEDAENNVAPLPNLYSAYNEQVIYIRVENNNTGCYATTSFMTILHPLPVIDIPNDLVLCLNDLPLTVTAGSAIGNSYSWSTGENTASIDITSIGTYEVTVTNQFGCTETASFTVSESELATITSVDVVNFSENNTITVNVTGNGDYVYSLDGGTSQASNLFEFVGPGYHVVTVLDTNGCGEISKEVVVVDYIKFFTPNNDTFNDTWHIIGIETLPNSVVYIFDRYGKLLKTLGSNDRGWNGLYRGRRMPSNDYWFLAEIKDGDQAFQVKGHFTLKR